MNPQATHQIIEIQLSAGTNNRGYKHIVNVNIVTLTPTATGQGWFDRQYIAERINGGFISAISNGGGSTAVVGTEQVGNALYLRTRADGTVEDNLLHLPTYDAAGDRMSDI